MVSAEREKEIGMYDDYYASSSSDGNIREGFFSPFTFLCFVLILALFGLLTLFSASYDLALSENRKFYHYFLNQAVSLILAGVCGIPLFFMPLKTVKRMHYVLIPVYGMLFALSLFTGSGRTALLSSFTALTGSLSLIFLFSDFLERILSAGTGKRRMSIILVLLSGLITVSVTQAGGTGWFLVDSLVMVSCLLSYGFKRGTVVFVSLSLLLVFVFTLLLSPELLADFARYLPGSEKNEGANILLALNAINEGGLEGVGIGNGLYKLGMIKGVEGEYIYASLSEETGIFGTALILFSCLMLFIIGIRSSSRSFRCSERFMASFTLSGITLICFSFLTNMMNVAGLVPFSGVPMPFFSYNPLCEALTVFLVELLYRFVYTSGREMMK